MRLPARLLRRAKNSYKNQYGHVLVVAGSSSMLGAACLTSLAALRSGCGLVTVACPQSLEQAFQKKINHAVMTLPLPEISKGRLSSKSFSTLHSQFDKYQAIAIGPGLGTQTQTKKLILELIKKCPLPMVVDADALNALAEDLSILKLAPASRILTPHAGEMKRLLQRKQSILKSQRSKIAKTFSQNYRCTLLLKGHHSVIAASNKRVSINQTGNPGMATAGSGDVLTGIIASLLSQGIESYDSAKLGALIHGVSGDLAAKKLGPTSLIATDLIEFLPKAIRKLS